MARGQSPYQGRYTVPIADFSGIERAGAAWGDAFKGIGQQVGEGIKKYNLNKEKDANLTASLEGKLDAMRLEDPERLAEIQNDDVGGKYLKDFGEGNLTLKGKEQMVGYLTGLSGGIEQITKARLAEANKKTAQYEATLKEASIRYNTQGREDVADLLESLEGKIKESKPGWIANQIDANNLSPKEANDLWNQTGKRDVNLGLLTDLSNRDKSILAQADLFQTNTAVPLRADQRTKLVADNENLKYQYDLAAAERKARPVADVLKEKERERETAAEIKAAEARQKEAAADIAEQNLIVAKVEAEDAEDRLKRDIEKSDNNAALVRMQIKEKKNAKKMLKKHPDGKIIQQELPDGTIVNMFYSGQSFQIIDTGQYTESQRRAASIKTFGPQLAEYYMETRDDTTGEIDDPDEMNPDFERMLLEMLGIDLSDGWPKGVKDEDKKEIPMYKTQALWLKKKKPSTQPKSTAAPSGKGGGVNPLNPLQLKKPNKK